MNQGGEGWWISVTRTQATQRMRMRLRGTTKGMFLYMCRTSLLQTHTSLLHGFRKVVRHPQEMETEIGSSKSKEVNSIYLCSSKHTRLSLNLDRSAKSPPRTRSKNYGTRTGTLRMKISVILTGSVKVLCQMKLHCNKLELLTTCT